MQLYSNAFDNNGIIPRQYTCEGTDLSPPPALGASSDRNAKPGSHCRRSRRSRSRRSPAHLGALGLVRHSAHIIATSGRAVATSTEYPGRHQ